MPDEPGETTTRWREVLAAFERVIAAPEAERDAALAAIRAQSPDIHQRVLALLAADQAAESANYLNGKPLDALAPTLGGSTADVADLSGQMVNRKSVV